MPVMADSEVATFDLNKDKELEDGEIDDLEEGEINEDIPSFSEYHFNPNEDNSTSGNDNEKRRQSKSQRVYHHEMPLRNADRKPNYSRRNVNRWTDSPLPRNEHIPWDRGGFNNENFGPRRPFWSDTNRNYKNRPPPVANFRRTHQSYNVPPPLMMSPSYPNQNYQKPYVSKLEPDENLLDQEDDFELLLKRYKHMQERLDELDGQEDMFGDDLIDDTFVDIPLDNNPVFEQEKENVENVALEKDLNESVFQHENSGNYLGEAEEPSEEYIAGKFSPFRINPSTKRVRTLSELNKRDLIARGLEQNQVGDGNAPWLEHESGENNDGGQQGEAQVCVGKGKPKRRRLRKNRKRRAAMGPGNQSGSKASSSDIYEKLGVAINKKNYNRAGKNYHDKKTILKRKQRLRAWQMRQQQNEQSVKQSPKNIDPMRDDYHEKPMDVDSDSTEGVGKIEDTAPPLPLVEVPPPPPPVDNITPHLIPLMEATPYGYYSSYVQRFINGPFSFENDGMETLQVPQNQKITETNPPEISTTAVVDESPVDNEVAEEYEDDDEASVQALREQLLKSMVTKRAAKSLQPPNTETSLVPSFSYENTRDASSPQVETPRSESPGAASLGKATAKIGVTPKLNIPPPKHEPVVIRIGQDSEDSAGSDNEGCGPMFGSFSGGLDSLIKEARERASKKSPEEPKTVFEPTTPDALSALPEEKRSEYKRLKQELALRTEQLQKEQTEGQKQSKKLDEMGKHKQQQQGKQQQQQQQQLQHQQEKERCKIQTSKQENVAAKTTETTQASLSIEQTRQDLREQVKNLEEKLQQHKLLVGQDKKLLDSTKDQLSDSSRALEEHEARVAILRQQLQRAERVKVVQKDLVNKLQIQNNLLSQRMFKRETAARELEERLLRSRALLVAQDARSTKPVTDGETFSQVANLTETTPSVPTRPTGRSLIEETRSRLSELSRGVKESILAKKKKIKVKAQLQSTTSSNENKNSPNASPSKSRKLTAEKVTKEKLRLKKLEEELSKRLRESNARHIAVRSRRTVEEKGVCSDSELQVKRISSTGRMTPPVGLARIEEKDKESVNVVAPSWNVFENSEELEKVKKIQSEKESSGPTFPNVSPNMALPVHLTSTQCIWLNIQDTTISKHINAIKGCATDPINPPQPVLRNEVVRKEVFSLGPGPYRSPLLHFRSYRFSPYFRTKKGLTLDSLTYSHLIDPHVSFCSFGLHGICSDPECTHQHIDDVVPKPDVILEDLAAYFPPAVTDAKEDIGKTIKASVETVAKQYEGKVSQAELRVLFVNQMKKKKKSSGVYNVVMERRPWRPCSYRRKDPGTTAAEESGSILTETTFSWKGWKQKLDIEINSRSYGDEECQEIRYFSENYDSVKTLEKATENNPADENLWIRLAMVHFGSSRTSGDSNNNKDNVDNALNILAQALEVNRHSEKLWLKYLELFRSKYTVDEIYEVCEEAVSLAPTYSIWWTYLDIASGHERKVHICLRLLQYLLTSDTEPEVKSHRLLESFLYIVQLDKLRGCNALAVGRFQAAVHVSSSKDWHETLSSAVKHLVCKDLSLFWLSYIHLVEFARLPPDLFDPATSAPSRIVCKDDFVFPWKPGGGTAHESGKLLLLFHRALKSCNAVVERRDKITPSLAIYKNLIALEQACGKPESAIRSCQRLLKASPKLIEIWFCLAALEQIGGSEETVTTVYKNALNNCNGYAQVAYSAAKYFLEKTNLKECYHTLVYSVSQKFTLDSTGQGRRTRAKSYEQKPLKQPEPMLLYKKLLSQPLPLGGHVPPLRFDVDPSKLGGECTYLWLCYCMFLEVFARVRPDERHKMTQGAYETAIHSTSDRKDIKLLWTEYLYYMVRGLEDKLSSADEIREIFHRCLVTVPVLTPMAHTPSKSWSSYKFHNEVLMLYRTCLGDCFSSTVFDKYLELFPDNSSLAIQAVEYAYRQNEVEKAKKILSTALLKMPYNIQLWKIAISVELKNGKVDQAKQLYQHAIEALPLAATLWKDFALFELSHDKTTDRNTDSVNEVVQSAERNDINLQDFLKNLLSK